MPKKFMLVFILLFIQCSFTKIDVYDVINNSSHTVYMTNIRPPADKTELTLEPGETKQLSYEYNAIFGYAVRFDYSPAEFVKVDIDMRKKKIVFSDLQEK